MHQLFVLGHPTNAHPAALTNLSKHASRFFMQSGSAYVPLDADLPEERAAFMMEDCQAPILVTREGLDSRLKVKRPISVVRMDPGWHKKLRASRKSLEPVSPDSLAYIMYTSG